MTNEIHIHMAKLRAKFIRHRAYRELSEQFDVQLGRRRAALQLGLAFEVEAIALTGAPGSGKTTAVDYTISKHKDLILASHEQDVCEVIQFKMPSPVTLKTVGGALSVALGYDLRRDKSAALIWQHVRRILKERKTLFVHLDELQDIYVSKADRTRSEVVNTLKSVMNNKDWPVGLILSGTPDLLHMVNADRQLQRRVRVIQLSSVSFATHGRDVFELLGKYAQESALSVASALEEDDFLKRLIHSAVNEFGQIIDMILCGIEECLLATDTVLEVSHFAEAFRKKAACLPAFNPFLAQDFLRIDVTRVRDVGEDQ
ncbi:hypothetical protein RA25_19770 [Leisingera sp. ANG-S5]|nr:hypothetical protein RA25_19770 [Leisingera sp. ANG-S5]